MLTGPLKPCPTIVEDDVEQLIVEVIVGTGSAYVKSFVVDCGPGEAMIPVPEGSGRFSIQVFTALGYTWLAAETPFSTSSGETTNAEISNLNHELETSAGGYSRGGLGSALGF